MTFSPGARVGPYEIADEIGAGGMGVVYRATDTKLGREVAIKTLPSTLAADTDRLARFDREAKLLAALNHPNIAVIYDLDEHEGTQFIVMELIEGDTLEEKLKGGPLPVEDALRLALQIAQALEAAHEKGVVHRDLKPANVMVTGKGQVKVLDFGLAKAFSEDPDASLGHSPALSLAMTQQGMILGTASYMSPEQASGQATDQRADVWAFGVVLFEMLSGLPLFTGESVPHILADVLKSEPDWNRLPKNLHPRLKLLLERCLKKKANNRYHAMADARIDIEEVLGDPAGAELEAVAAQPLWRRALPFAATALIAGVLVGLVYDLLRPAPSASTSSSVVSDAGLRRWTVDIDTGAVAGSGLGVELDVSADGSTVAYATGGPDAAVYLRRLDQFEPTLLPGTEAARFPFFSPGGEWLGVLGGGAVRKFSVLGGPPQTLANVGRMLGVSWGDDEFIVVASAVPTGGMGMGMGAETAGSLLRLPAAGGAPEILLDAEPGSWYQWPEVLPGATGVLFTIHPEGEAATESSIAVLEMETREYRTLIFGGYNARYAPTGHIVFARAGALWAVPFDLERLQVTGTETPMVEGVQTNSLTGNVPYAFSDKGLLVYVLGADVSGANFGGNSNLIWVDREGREELLGAEPRGYIDAHLSPDGQRVAVSIFDGGAADIWVYDLNRETLSRVTFGPDPNFFPLWMPDGERILYSSTRAGEGGIFRIAANGTGQEEQLMTGTGIQFLNSISGDGRYVSVANNGDMFSMSLEGEREIVPTVQTTFNEGWDSLSPDGRWLAYGSNETGRWELYVRPFPDVDTERWQISTTGASADRALWSPDGSELYYLSAEGEFLAVAIETETTFSWSSAAVLFPWDSADAPLGVSPDGERFLAIRSNAETDDGSGSTSIAFVDNWFDDLRRLAPTE